MTTALKPLKGHEITKPGLYLVHPVVAGFGDQTLWLTEVKFHRNGGPDDLLIYTLLNGEERVVRGCGYTFFEYPNDPKRISSVQTPRRTKTLRKTLRK
jgi:hypothetical protein